jgi:hypothetical protein
MIVVATPGASVEQRGRHHGNGRGIVEGARPVDDSDEGHFRARTAEPLGRGGVEAGTVGLLLRECQEVELGTQRHTPGLSEAPGGDDLVRA